MESLHLRLFAVKGNSMRTSLREIEQMAAILADEAEGRQVDRLAAARLAARLAESCPEIRLSMQRIAERMWASAAS